MKQRQQNGNAPSAAQGISRADEQRCGGIDHSSLGKGQMLPQVRCIGVGTAAGGTKLLIMQPGHGRAKHGQRRYRNGPRGMLSDCFRQEKSSLSGGEPPCCGIRNAKTVSIMIPYPQQNARSLPVFGQPHQKQPMKQCCFLLAKTTTILYNRACSVYEK